MAEVHRLQEASSCWPTLLHPPGIFMGIISFRELPAIPEQGVGFSDLLVQAWDRVSPTDG